MDQSHTDSNSVKRTKATRQTPQHLIASSGRISLPDEHPIVTIQERVWVRNMHQTSGCIASSLQEKEPECTLKTRIMDSMCIGLEDTLFTAFSIVLWLAWTSSNPAVSSGSGTSTFFGRHVHLIIVSSVKGLLELASGA